MLAQKCGQAEAQGRVHKTFYTALRNICKLSYRDAEEVKSKCHRLAVEIAAGDRFIVVWEDDRIVRDRINLARNGRIDVFNSVAARTMYLRGAAERICILNLALDFIGGELAAVKKLQKILGAVYLPLMTAHLMHLVIVRLFDAEHGFRAHSAGNIGGFDELHSVVHRKAADGGHYLRSVYERKPLLCGKLHGRDSSPLHGLGTAHDFSLVLRFALAYHYEHDMRKGREVSACAERALFGNDGMHARVEHREERFDCGEPDAGIAPAERVAAEQHRCAHGLGWKGISHAA